MECKTSEKVSDADVKSFKEKTMPPTKEVKCLTTCIIEKMGLVGMNCERCGWFYSRNFYFKKISNNQINKEGALKIAKAMPNSNEKMVESVNEMVEECKAVKEADR